VAKFDGDRPRELGDLALKKKENITDLPLLRTGGLKNITGKIEDLPYYRTGRSNNYLLIRTLP